LDQFTQQLREWQVFYSTVALASVTLAGLLFVSLSLHSESLKGRKDSLQMRLARGSFGDFLYVLMLGLVFLVPHQAPFGLAVALFVLGAARGFGLARQAVKTVRKRAKGEPITNVLREIALPALASLGLIVIAVEVLRGNYLSIYGLVIVVAALLATASWNAWLILIEEDAAGL
jgi:GNAT superfamily N-acetyltransferase